MVDVCGELAGRFLLDVGLVMVLFANVVDLSVVCRVCLGVGHSLLAIFRAVQEGGRSWEGNTHR